MSDSEPDESDDLSAEDSVVSPDGDSTWAVSVCFWLALVMAATSYAAVALAPKYSMWSDARHEYRTNGAQLAALEQKVDYLERVKTTLETDPEFVLRLTQASSAEETGDEVTELIPVSGNLLFGESDGDNSEVVSDEPEQTVSKSGLVTALATSGRVRTGLLTFSACLTVFAFTFLNDAGTGLVNQTGRLLRSVAMLPIARYVSKEDASAELEDENDD